MAVLQVVVTGGAGQIAYSLIPLIARGLVFGAGMRVGLRLLDIPASARSLEGVAMEVQDSLFSTILDGVLATTDEAAAFDGAQVAILLGGFPRRPGMERGDLFGKNAGIMKRMGEALERHASRSCKVLVVANPAPSNCLVLASHAPSLPRKNFSCLSRLDHDRMVGLLLDEANRCLGVNGTGATNKRLGAEDVRGACVWGNHSNSQVPDASAVEFLVGGRWTSAATVIRDAGWLDLSDPGKEGLAETVRARGATVLAARKLSSALSAANAIAGHLSDWLLAPSGSGPANAVSMGVCSDGNPFGVPDGLFCSFPVHCVGAGEWKFAREFQLTEEACRQLNNSVKELQEEKAMMVTMLDGEMLNTSPPTLPPAAVVGSSERRPLSSL